MTMENDADNFLDKAMFACTIRCCGVTGEQGIVVGQHFVTSMNPGYKDVEEEPH